MSTISETSDKQCCITLGNLSPDDVIITWLLRRFEELPKESLSDIVSLLEIFMDTETSDDERCEIYATLREILFPQTIGKVIRKSPNSVHVPHQISQRTDWIGNKVRNYREEKGWNQSELAKKSGLRQPQISRLEAGVHSPSYKTLEKIAKALGKKVGDLDPSYQ